MKPIVYISYSWGKHLDSKEERAVIKLCSTLTDQGFEVVNDGGSADYHDSLPTLYRVLGSGGVVIPIIGKKYLKQINCLVESSFMATVENISKRMFPLILSNYYDIYNPFNKAILIEEVEIYWK